MRIVLILFFFILVLSAEAEECEHYDVVGFKEDQRVITILVGTKLPGGDRKTCAIELPFSTFGKSNPTRSAANVIAGSFSQKIADEKFERDAEGFILNPLYDLSFSVPQGKLAQVELWAFNPILVNFENVRKYVANNPIFAKP